MTSKMPVLFILVVAVFGALGIGAQDYIKDLLRLEEEFKKESEANNEIPAVEISIKDLPAISGVLGSTSVTCNIRSNKYLSSQIKRIEIIHITEGYNAKTKTVASVSMGEGPESVDEINTKADGVIYKGSASKSYLNLVLDPVLPGDEGIYQCGVSYIDTKNITSLETKEKILPASKIGAQEYIKHLLSLAVDLKKESKANNDKIQAQESQISSLDASKKMMGKEIEQQNLKLYTLDDRIKNQTDKDFLCLFSAQYVRGMEITLGEVILFKNVIMNYGDAYNSTTGIFTAPKNGIYSFTITVMTNKNTYVKTRLEHVNHPSFAAIWSYDRNYYGQSSISTLIKLFKGDQVLPRAKIMQSGVKDLAPNGLYSIFTGQLIVVFD